MGKRDDEDADLPPDEGVGAAADPSATLANGSSDTVTQWEPQVGGGGGIRPAGWDVSTSAGGGALAKPPPMTGAWRRGDLRGSRCERETRGDALRGGEEGAREGNRRPSAHAARAETAQTRRRPRTPRPPARVEATCRASRGGRGADAPRRVRPLGKTGSCVAEAAQRGAAERGARRRRVVEHARRERAVRSAVEKWRGAVFCCSASDKKTKRVFVRDRRFVRSLHNIGNDSPDVTYVALLHGTVFSPLSRSAAALPPDAAPGAFMSASSQAEGGTTFCRARAVNTACTLGGGNDGAACTVASKKASIQA